MAKILTKIGSQLHPFSAGLVWQCQNGLPLRKWGGGNAGSDWFEACQRWVSTGNQRTGLPWGAISVPEDRHLKAGGYFFSTKDTQGFSSDGLRLFYTRIILSRIYFEPPGHLLAFRIPSTPIPPPHSPESPGVRPCSSRGTQSAGHPRPNPFLPHRRQPSLLTKSLKSSTLKRGCVENSPHANACEWNVSFLSPR